MLADAAGDLEKLDALEDIWSGTLKALAAEGVEYVVYLTVNHDYGDPFTLTNIPEIYSATDPGTDPFLHHCCNSYDVTYLGTDYMDSYAELSDEERTFILHAFESGYSCGLGIPMRLQGSPRFGGFNLGTPLKKAEFEKSIGSRKEEFRLFCLLIHRRIEEITHSAKIISEEFRDLLIAPATGVLNDLSPREREVIYLVARGMSRKECARTCGISPYTVAEYVQSAYRKLGVQNRFEVARMLMG